MGCCCSAWVARALGGRGRFQLNMDQLRTDHRLFAALFLASPPPPASSLQLAVHSLALGLSCVEAAGHGDEWRRGALAVHPAYVIALHANLHVFQGTASGNRKAFTA